MDSVIFYGQIIFVMDVLQFLWSFCEVNYFCKIISLYIGDYALNRYKY